MKRYLPITIAAFIWVWPAIFIKILSSYFDNFTQNFYRFLAASVVLIIINLVYHKKEFLNSLRNVKRFIFPAILMFTFQIIWVAGIFLLTPTIAVLIVRSSVLFVTFFSFIFFHDERKIIKSKAFIFGSLLAIIGVCGVILGKNGSDLSFNSGNFIFGVILILISAILWALYLITIKTIVKKTYPIVSAGIIYTLSVPLFFVASLVFGNIGTLLIAPKSVIAILFLSGIFCVGMANALNFKSIKLIGAAISSNFVLITPFFTAVASYLIFKEILTFPQILFGAILLTGCAILIRARNHLKE
jgi:drug/metabolite transporter (DMT)-like permease